MKPTLLVLSVLICAGFAAGPSAADRVLNTGDEKAPQIKQHTSNTPNILLIVVETLRADHVSCLGYQRDTTPSIDRLASQGVLFTNTIAASSWTLPSCMSILTSLYPGVHGVTNTSKQLPQNATTLAEILKAEGYATIAFVSSPTPAGKFGLGQGFDLYDDFSIVELDLGLNIFGAHEATGLSVHHSMTSKAMNRLAMTWLRNNGNKKFFMFLFYFDPHFPYKPPGPHNTMFDPDYQGTSKGPGNNLRPALQPLQRDLEHIKALYDGDVRYTDDHLGELMSWLAEKGLLENTLVVLTGDHGDEFWEHGGCGHATSLYDELVHVPLIFRYPKKIPQNKKVSMLTSHVDIMPTILDLAGIEYDGLMQGQSLYPTMIGREVLSDRAVLSEVNIVSNHHYKSLRTLRHKLIYFPDEGLVSLFDLANDPQEQQDISKVDTTTTARLQQELSNTLWHNELAAKSLWGAKEQEPLKIDPETERRLRALGYIQ